MNRFSNKKIFRLNCVEFHKSHNFLGHTIKQNPRFPSLTKIGSCTTLTEITSQLLTSQGPLKDEAKQ